MHFKYILLALALAPSLHGASSPPDTKVFMQYFIDKMGVTPIRIKFSRNADYTSHHYPECLQLSMEALTKGVSLMTRALNEVLVKREGDTPEKDQFKCMIYAETVSHLIQLMHDTYVNDRYNFVTDPAFRLTSTDEPDAVKKCLTLVGRDLAAVQQRLNTTPDFAQSLGKFRTAQLQYPELACPRHLKHAVREVFIEADDFLRQDALSRDPEVVLDISFAAYTREKKEAKANAKGLRKAATYLASIPPTDITAVILSTNIL